MDPEFATALSVLGYVVAITLVIGGFTDKIAGHFESAKKLLAWLYRSGGRRRKMHGYLTSGSGRAAMVIAGVIAGVLATVGVCSSPPPPPPAAPRPLVVALVYDEETRRLLADAKDEREVREVLDRKGGTVLSAPSQPAPPKPAPPPPPPPAPIPLPMPSVATVSDIKRELEANLQMWEFYPKYEWPLSGDATTASRSIEGQTLRAVFNPTRDDYRLTPLLFNGNAKNGVPLLSPNIDIFLPVAVEAKRTQLWAPNINDMHRVFSTWADFGPVLTAPSSVNESLFLKFPSPSRYQVRFRLSGVAKGIALRKDGEFTLELVEPTP